MKVIKRDGRTEGFNGGKIFNAVFSAACRTKSSCYPIAENVTYEVSKHFANLNEIPVDDIHDFIEKILMKRYPNVAKEYIVYRQHRTDIRESKSSLMEAIAEISTEMHKDNANTNNSAASKMYGIAEAANKRYVLSKVISPIHAQNHRNGKIYINDLGCNNAPLNRDI